MTVGLRSTAGRPAGVLIALLVLAAPAHPVRAGWVSLSGLGSGEIVTVAGASTVPAAVAAAEASLPAVSGLAVDPRDGTVYLAEATRHALFRLRPGSDTLEHLAGSGIAGFGGDGGPAREAVFHVPTQLAVDPRNGDLLVADSQNHRVRLLSRDGSRVRSVAGSGVRGLPDETLPTLVPKGPDLAVGHFSGDGGPAEEAELNLPSGVACDRQGNLYVADSGNHRVRVVNRQGRPLRLAGVEVAPGAIRTVAGTGEAGASGDGGIAREAQLAFPKSLALDGAGGLLVVDAFNHRLRRVDLTSGVIETVARGDAGRGKPPEELPGQGWSSPSLDGVAAGPGGEVYYSDLNGHAIHLWRPGGHGELAAGVGLPGRSADGAPAAGSPIAGPGALAVGPAGEVVFAETGAARVRRLHDGLLGTLAGGGEASGRGAATEVAIPVPGAVGVAPGGDLCLADQVLRAVRCLRLDAGTVEVLAGLAGQVGRGTALVFGPDGELYVADAARNRILRSGPPGGAVAVATYAGDGRFGSAGDGGPAHRARLAGPAGLALHPLSGELYLSTLERPAIRRIDRQGTISTVAGSGREGFAGDGGPALEARFRWPMGLAFDRRGNLYVADFFNQRVRRIDPGGTISTFAGTGERGSSGDGGPAAGARLNGPTDLAVDARGNLYVADSNNHRVRRIDAAPPHLIRTVAGTGERGFAGDGGPATEARLNLPRGVAIDRRGVLFIADSLNGRIRAVRLEDTSEDTKRPGERNPS